MSGSDAATKAAAAAVSGQEDDPPLVGKKKSDEKKIGGKQKYISGHSTKILPTNGLPTNKTEREIKRGWIEWAAHNTKKYGKRRYPRHREWEWNGEKWVKSSPVYNARSDLKILNEADYVKYAERRDRAKKLGY